MTTNDTKEIDWKGLYKTVDLPKTVAEAVARRDAPYLKWPKLMYWKDLKADVRGFNWARHEKDNRQWPDQTEEWDEEVQQAIEDGHATSEGEALKYLYDNDEEFMDCMDELWINELEYCEEQDRKRRMALWHRAAWAAVWSRRLRGPENPVRWADPADRELPCPKCKGVAAAQASNARGKRKASCCACGYTFKVVKAARSE